LVSRQKKWAHFANLDAKAILHSQPSLLIHAGHFHLIMVDMVDNGGELNAVDYTDTCRRPAAARDETERTIEKART
jgi:hypothetical protein